MPVPPTGVDDSAVGRVGRVAHNDYWFGSVKVDPPVVGTGVGSLQHHDGIA